MKDDKTQETKETAQQKALLKETVEILSNKAMEKEKAFKQLDVKCEIQFRKLNELEQQKIIGSEMSNWQETKTHRAKAIYLLIVIVIVTASVGSFVIFYNSDGGSLLRVSPQFLNNYNSNYVIQNLQGDTVDTWVSWNIPKDRVLHVHIVNTANLSQDKMDIIKGVIQSTQTVSIDDSLNGKGPKGTSSVYYFGWQGAAAEAYSEPTKLYIPQQFDINGSPDAVGDIEIILTNDVSPDGYSGYTKSLVDGNQILKSKITLYQANRIDNNWLAAVVRHEFGHALGLGHSTANEDLMNAMIQTNYPVISECDVDALKGLYDGDKNSKVVCKK